MGEKLAPQDRLSPLPKFSKRDFFGIARLTGTIHNIDTSELSNAIKKKLEQTNLSRRDLLEEGASRAKHTVPGIAIIAAGPIIERLGSKNNGASQIAMGLGFGEIFGATMGLKNPAVLAGSALTGLLGSLEYRAIMQGQDLEGKLIDYVLGMLDKHEITTEIQPRTYIPEPSVMPSQLEENTPVHLVK